MKSKGENSGYRPVGDRPLETGSGRPVNASTIPTTFDPISNRHLWTMWRISVNEKIVKETKYRLENPDAVVVYSDSLIQPPLHYYIHRTPQSDLAAEEYKHSHDRRKNSSKLQTGQFIYFGLPRVIVSAEDRQDQDHEVLMILERHTLSMT
ncbi:hypothetical protein ScPMuIL_001212 [Solemya velum]